MNKIKQFLHNPIFYKVCVDLLFLFTLVTIAFIIFETIIPGIISVYISPITLFAIIFVFVAGLYFIAHLQNIYTNITKSNKYLLGLSTILFSILVAISSFKYDYLFGGIIVIFSIVIFFLLNKLLQDILHNI